MKYTPDQVTQMARHVQQAVLNGDPRYVDFLTRLSARTGRTLAECAQAVDVFARQPHPGDR